MPATKTLSPPSTFARKVPWNDKAGRFAPLKALTLVLLPLPALWLTYRAQYIGLGARPLTEAIHFIGQWTVYFLLMTLAITPARRLFEWSKLIQIRRILGLTTLYYILGHLALYIVDSGWNLWFVAKEIVLRIYLTIGFTAVLGLVVLGVTSTDGMIKRMGALAWNRLHRIVYVVGVLAFLHYYMQAKADVTQPVLFSGFFFWLMGYRVMAKLGYKHGLVPLLTLSVAAAVTTALAEAAWYQIMRPGIGMRVLIANFDPSQVRPAWWVLVAGLAVTLASEIRRRLSGVRTPARTASVT